MRPGSSGAKSSVPSLRPGAADGYRIRRILYHLDHYYTGGTYRDWLIRLCRRERGSFGGLEPHASVTVDGRIERLKSPILHFSYRDVADHVSTINRLSTLSALEGEPGALTAFKIAANPAWRFFNLYLLRGGFLDGGRGLYAAISSAFYVFLKYAKTLRAPNQQALSKLTECIDVQHGARCPFLLAIVARAVGRLLGLRKAALHERGGFAKGCGGIDRNLKHSKPGESRSNDRSRGC